MRSDLLKFRWRGWSLVALIVLALALTACGGATSTEEESAPTEAEESAAEEEPAAEEEAAATEEEPAEETEAATETDESDVTADDEEAATETDESDAATEEEAATEDENLLDPTASTSEAAECVPVDIPENSLIAEVSEADWSLGPADAPLTVIEYGDFQ